MGTEKLLTRLRYNPPWLVLNSVGRAAGRRINPHLVQSWVNELDKQVLSNGKFSKLQVIYAPVSPPPVFWDYKCKKCRVWMGPNGCKWVKGNISPNGWCVIWLPPTQYRELSWPKELLRGEW